MKSISKKETLIEKKGIKKKKIQKSVFETKESKNKSIPSKKITIEKNIIPKNKEKKIHNILITLPKPVTGKSPYLELENKLPVKFHFYPFFEIEGIPAKDIRKQKLEISSLTSVIFTSRNTVDHFFRLVEELKLKVSQEIKYFCISEAVALYLQKFILYRKRKVFYSADGSNEGLKIILEKFKDSDNFLYPTSESSNDEMENFMKKNKFKYLSLNIFKIIPSTKIEETYDMLWDCIVFFSPNSVNIFNENKENFKFPITRVAGFGKNTLVSLACVECTEIIKASKDKLVSMAAILEDYYSNFFQKK